MRRQLSAVVAFALCAHAAGRPFQLGRKLPRGLSGRGAASSGPGGRVASGSVAADAASRRRSRAECHRARRPGPRPWRRRARRAERRGRDPRLSRARRRPQGPQGKRGAARAACRAACRDRARRPARRSARAARPTPTSTRRAPRGVRRSPPEAGARAADGLWPGPSGGSRRRSAAEAPRQDRGAVLDLVRGRDAADALKWSIEEPEATPTALEARGLRERAPREG